jgi:hypothetical protein
MVYYLMTKPMAVRAALPLRAIVAMNESYQDAAPLPDFEHCISTDISAGDFQSFVAAMKLVPYRGTKSFPSCDAQWWTASGDASGAFYSPKNEEAAQAMAKLENGKLYYVANHNQPR